MRPGKFAWVILCREKPSRIPQLPGRTRSHPPPRALSLGAPQHAARESTHRRPKQLLQSRFPIHSLRNSR
jgi:hypothetical protein